MKKIKKEILEEVLKHSAFDGWNDATLEAACKSLGHDQQYAYVVFPAGISDLIDFYAEENDQAMLAKLKKLDLKSIKIRERIATSVMVRLDLYKNHKESIRQLVAYYILPQNIGQSIISIAKTMDKMWYAAGDTSADFNYYTKRLLLAGVFISTMIYWLNDESKNYKSTKEFLDRRIANVMQIQKYRGKAESLIDRISSFMPNNA